MVNIIQPLVSGASNQYNVQIGINPAGDLVFNDTNGDILQANQATPTNTAATTVWGNIVTVTLTPGDWSCSGVICIRLNGATQTACNGAISVNTGNTTTDQVIGANQVPIPVPLATGDATGTIAAYQISVPIGSTQAVFLKAVATFSAGNPQAYGSLVCRRFR